MCWSTTSEFFVYYVALNELSRDYGGFLLCPWQGVDTLFIILLEMNFNFAEFVRINFTKWFNPNENFG